MLAELSERPLEQVSAGGIAGKTHAGKLVEIGNLPEIDVVVRRVKPGDGPIRHAERLNAECKTRVAAVQPRSGVRHLEEIPRPVQRAKERWKAIVVDGCDLAREIPGEIVPAFEQVEYTREVAVAAQLPVFFREEDLSH